MKRFYGGWGWLSAGLALVLVLGAGCGKSVTQSAAEKIAEKAIEHEMAKNGQQGSVKIDGDKVSMEVKDKDGKRQQMQVHGGGDGMAMTVQGEKGAQTLSTGANAKLPAAFPKDVPMYAGAKLEMVIDNPGENACSVQAKTADPLEKVAAALEKDVAAQGWTAGESTGMAGDQAMKMLSYKKGNRTLNLMLTKQENETGIMLTLGQEQ